MLRNFLFREPWRTRLLLASLACNLFAAGLIAAHLAGPRPRPPGPDRGLERIARDLAPSDAERFRAALSRTRPPGDQARQRMDEARLAVSRAIGQTPYDEAAVRRAMQDFQAAQAEVSNQFGASMLAGLAELSPDGRKRLAEAGQRRPLR